MNTNPLFKALVAIVAIVALLAVSCASAPDAGLSAAPAESAVTAKAVERIETIKVPVLIEEKAYLADGTLDRTTLWKYDASLREILERRVVEAGRPEPVETLTRAVSDGIVVETLLDAEGRLVSRKTTTLDVAGRKIRETVEGSGKERGAVSEWIYDSDGNPAEWRVTDAAGLLVAVTKYDYSGGRLTVARMYDPSGALEGRLDHEYDSAGHLVVRTLSDASGKLERRENFAWRDGLLVEESTFGRSGALERRAAHEFGPDGSVIATVIYDQAGRVRQKLTFTYAWREETRVVASFE